MARINIALVLSAALLVACKKQPVVEVVEPTVVADPVASPAQITQLRENFSRVHFEFDSAALTAEGREALSANAAILVRHPRLTIEIQGHADERGSTDYNLALGQRRAEAIRSHLIAQGVRESRVKVISYGEERPLEYAESEIAWSANRRAEFRILRDGGLVMGTTED